MIHTQHISTFLFSHIRSSGLFVLLGRGQSEPRGRGGHFNYFFDKIHRSRVITTFPYIILLCLYVAPLLFISIFFQNYFLMRMFFLHKQSLLLNIDVRLSPSSSAVIQTLEKTQLRSPWTPEAPQFPNPPPVSLLPTI